MRNLMIVPLAALVAAGCGFQGSGSITPTPSADPSAAPSADVACTVTQTRAAQTYGLDAPAEAAADTPFTATVWVYEDKTPSVAVETAMPGTFRGVVDAAAKTITYGGEVSAVVPNPDAGCAFPMIAGANATGVVVTTSAPAGTYRLVLAHMATDFPVPPMTGPEPVPLSREIVVR